MVNALTDNTNLLLIGGTGLSAILAFNFDEKFQDYSQVNGLMPSKVSKFGDLYGGTWSAWMLPVSVIITSKFADETNEEMLQKLDYSISAIVANGVTTVILKELISRKRPNGKGFHSMPSGHTSNSFTVAAVVNELYGSEAGITAYILAGLVGISRIHDNKHYLSDVIVGACIGTIIGRGFAKTYNEYKTDKNKNTFNLNVSFSLH
jgi:membrane-associated phospholipid phosphatase